MDERSPVGVFDSGVGGFSVVKEIQKILPREDVVYYGDSANMPYGNRSGEDILHLTRQILAFLERRGVKAALVACNTISSLIDRYRDDYPFKIFSVIEAGVASVVTLDINCVGVIGTVFTVQSGGYKRLINAVRPEMKVYAQGSPNLARLIDGGDLRPELIDPELRASVEPLLAQAPIQYLILGCTHYPLISGRLNCLYPQLTLIDPAHEQALALKRFLESQRLLNHASSGSLEMNTSGNVTQYAKAVRRFGLKEPCAINNVAVAQPL
ncbi:MAG: glutamate racemase [Pyramidobacter sp.]|jgi:glutamate racemase